VTEILIIGLQIRLAPNVGCAECGETAVAIGSGAGPDMPALYCTCCERHRGYLPKAVADLLLTAIEKFGRPTLPITVCHSQLAAPSGAVAIETFTSTL
jgi:hypothetical protein